MHSVTSGEANETMEESELHPAYCLPTLQPSYAVSQNASFLIVLKIRANSTWPTFYLHTDDNIKCNGNSLLPGGIREQLPTKEGSPHKYNLCSPHKTYPTCPKFQAFWKIRNCPAWFQRTSPVQNESLFFPKNKHDLFPSLFSLPVRRHSCLEAVLIHSSFCNKLP